MKLPAFPRSADFSRPVGTVAPISNRLQSWHATRAAAFSFLELMIAMSISMLIMGGVMFFVKCAGISLSGVSSQSLINQKAGNAIEFIQSRALYATWVSNDSSGNVLTYGFDDDYDVDTDGDKIAYNDENHFERFQFIGVNGSTNTTKTNSIVYYPDINQTNRQILVGFGVHNLPGYNIFTLTNGYTAIIRFSVVDPYTNDNYQSIDIQATAVPMNRPWTTNQITIIP